MRQVVRSYENNFRSCLTCFFPLTLRSITTAGLSSDEIISFAAICSLTLNQRFLTTIEILPNDKFSILRKRFFIEFFLL